jgi:hypothetical protein
MRDPHVRWCGRSRAVRPAPISIRLTGVLVKKQHTDKDSGHTIYEIDTVKLTGTYYPVEDSDFGKLVDTLELVGFKSLPKGFSTQGYGFASPAGTYLTKAMTEGFGEGIKLRIVKSGVSSARKYKERITVTLTHSDYLRILDTLRDIRTERNIKSRGHVASVLGELFPRYFQEEESVETIYTYEEDKITKILSASDVLEILSKNDVDTISRIYREIAEDSAIDFANVGVAKDQKDKNEKVYLEAVIEEFESRLKKKTLSEPDWQRFLQKYILLFNTSYVNVIQKMSVSLKGKFPDFILVNVYGYLDIYEIKKPNTNLLKHDSSRDNYYWDAEVSRAIIQTENYVQMLVRSAADVKDIIEEKHGIRVKVVRPRGFIIVGASTQFETKKMEDDFRLLASSLKNVDVILYDELLENLKNLTERLS